MSARADFEAAAATLRAELVSEALRLASVPSMADAPWMKIANIAVNRTLARAGCGAGAIARLAAAEVERVRDAAS